MDVIPEQIIESFKHSWAETQQFYSGLIDSDPSFDKLIPLYLFIQKLKKTGADKYFRLGTSMQDLIFSRSAAFSLRPDQKFIRVQAVNNSFVISLREGQKLIKEYRIKDLEDELLKGLLQTLKDALIN